MAASDRIGYRRLRFHDRWFDGGRPIASTCHERKRGDIAARSLIRDLRVVLARWDAVVDAEAKQRASASQWRLFTSLREPVR
jgi:hypothetical protein